MGRLVTDDQAYRNLNSVLAKTTQVVTNIQEGQGTLGKLVVSDELYGKVNTAVDNVNVIMSDVRSQKGTLGKLLYDPSLYDEAKKALSGRNASNSARPARQEKPGHPPTHDPPST